MKLGAFSISLAVKDIEKSKAFYENLGFTNLGGDLLQKWLILKNGNAIIGLFEGMFENNIITFNPGWDENGQNTEPFDDVRSIQQHLKNCGMALQTEAEPATSGPAFITLTDPDGNAILIGQHR
jgi:catechol 2,3-dioxygenase-like lactoylglutathione lyase family enzyme